MTFQPHVATPGVLRALLFASAVGCAATIPKAELDRCQLGVTDGNEGFALPQGPACRSVAQRLVADDRREEAIAYARRACQLEDGPGCEAYVRLVQGQADPGPELQGARAAGERACSGIVLAADGVDARPVICARTADLYLAVPPKSPRDAGRLYARACALGDAASCDRAAALGVTAPAPAPPPARAPVVPVAPVVAPSATAPAHPAPVCHDLRGCVALDVRQRNTSEVQGTLANHCERPVFCSFCPARGASVDRGACRTVTLAPGESRSGKGDGLWYDGYSGIAYDCSDAADDRSCTP